MAGERIKGTRRELGLTPRKPGNLPPEKLREILGGIYPEEIAEDLMDRLAAKVPSSSKKKEE